MVTPHVGLNAGLDTLTDTHRIASSLSQFLTINCNITTPLPCITNSTITIPELVLTFPDDLVAPINELDISLIAREEILLVIRRRVAELQQQFTSAYTQACLETSRSTNFSMDLLIVKQTYQSLYQKQVASMVSVPVAFLLKEISKNQQSICDAKKAFNFDSIPVLEKYFEMNAYPSMSHKSILAQKFDMSTRQIEVWFQNHRRRAKTEGKRVPRLESDLPLKRALSILPKNPQPYNAQPHQPRFFTPSHKGTITNGVDYGNEVPAPKCKPASVLEETDGEDGTTQAYRIRPPHAFPSTRKSVYDDPFPNNNGVFRFPPPVWTRKPATTPITPTAVDMDDFARLFHMKLNFVNGPWKRESTPSKVNTPSFTPWFAPSRTIPPPAPLPSLVKTCVSSPVSSSVMSLLAMDPFIFDFGGVSQKPGISCVVRLPFGPSQSPSSNTASFMRPEAPRKETAPVPAASSSDSSFSVPPGEVSRRKVLPMPRRTPSTFQSFGSRTSSFSSDTSYSSDDSSSSPSTPPPLPNQDLISDPLLESYEATLNLDNYLDLSSWTCNPSPRSFDFFDKPTQDEQASSLFQNFTPLVSTC